MNKAKLLAYILSGNITDFLKSQVFTISFKIIRKLFKPFIMDLIDKILVVTNNNNKIHTTSHKKALK